MPEVRWDSPQIDPLPIILIRGFGGLKTEDEQKQTYQGFNQGTVYPHRRGDNYIYEGMILKFLKSDYGYVDATNVLQYGNSPFVDKPSTTPDSLQGLPKGAFYGRSSNASIVVNPTVADRLVSGKQDIRRSLWVFRYYDLQHRSFTEYGAALLRVIDLIQRLVKIQQGGRCKINIVAHSMGGLIARQLVQVALPEAGGSADATINKIVTLGTPHRGISFQVLKNVFPFIGAEEELEAFSPGLQRDGRKALSFKNFPKHFSPQRCLSVVGTDFRSYGIRAASFMNRLIGMPGEGGWANNKSDGLVQQTSAWLPDSVRTFVHKCHGGLDSVVTSRESYEATTRFFFGDVRYALFLESAKIKKGKDIFGKSEFFFGVTVKPRGNDFELFRQGKREENCYGPFRKADLNDRVPVQNWPARKGKSRMVLEGFLDTTRSLSGPEDIVFRVNFYVSERDTLGIGFSDNKIFMEDRYIRATTATGVQLYCHEDETFAAPGAVPPEKDMMEEKNNGWLFHLSRPAFEATFRLTIGPATEAAPE